ncbi:ABC transporter ATP-binding protein [Cohnella massiliensis]|uniref:ABC transporter ATP-binding protein n=1 Tax=Cohnella massiliensis TaxID=1816691 RepID=UPI0009BC604A|nr:ABC transporter ATP-binding protein [Cohnella massiliensis]
MRENSRRSGGEAPSGPAPRYGRIRNMLRYVYPHVRAQKGRIAIAFVCMLLIALLEFVIPQLTAYTIDRVIPERRSDQLILIAAAIVGTAVLLGAFNFASGYTMSAVGQRVVYDLRNQLYRHIQRMDLGFFDRNRTGDLMSRVTSDVNMLQQLVSSSMLSLLTDAFTFVAVACYMFYKDWLLTCIMLATFPFMTLATRKFGRRIRGASRKVQESVAEVNNHLQDSFSSIRLIKSFTTEDYEAVRFGAKSRANMEASVQAAGLRAVYEPLIDLLNYIGMDAVLLVGALQAIRGKLSVGEIVAFLAYLRLLQNPVRHFSRALNTVQQSSAAFERIQEMLRLVPEIRDKEGAIELPPIRGAVSFRHVDFAYGNGVPVLRDFSLELAPGTMTALVGSSGAGKTTLAHLLARFYDPQGGEIAIDGYRLADVRIRSLRDQIGIVSQDVMLLNGTVRENIAYGKPGATDAEVEAAARSAAAHEFVAALPDGYESQIGERGVKLSGGQKQRLSIARALLRDPRLIILDEATSALDTESEQQIQEALSRLLAGRTSIVIAHRLSTIQRADRIVVLEAGAIVESGTHESLLRLNGRYRQLHDLQFPQEKTEAYAGPMSSVPAPSSHPNDR